MKKMTRKQHVKQIEMVDDLLSEVKPASLALVKDFFEKCKARGIHLDQFSIYERGLAHEFIDMIAYELEYLMVFGEEKKSKKKHK